MNQNQFFSFIYHFLFFFFTFFCLERNVSAADDPSYTICKVPVSCGGKNISFPFYIAGQQDPICGHPGFQLSCHNNETTILTLPDGNNLTIQEILYQNQSIRVSNSVVSDSGESSCIVPIKNTTIHPDRFWLAPNNEEVVLLSGCNLTAATNDLLQHQANCSELRVDDSVLALLLDDPVLGNASAKCKEVITTPVDLEGGIKGSVEDLLKRGFVMRWIASDCSDCDRSGGKCGFDNSTYLFKCFCTDRPHSRSCKDNKNLALKLGLGISGSAVVLISLSIFIVWYCMYRRKHAFSNSRERNTSNNPSLSDLEGNNVYFGAHIFSYKELDEATSHFEEKKEIGDGGFGTVYYGKLKDGREVAIKRLYEHNFKRVSQFMNEVEILTRLRHKNLVSLYGCTSHHSRELLLVYEFIPNGTIADHLHGDHAKPGSLPWPVRMSIAIETANALAYLHASGIIHRDVKTNNILLDNNFGVKVADFGLSRLFPMDATHISTAPQGTPGYVDPEYHQCYQLTEKSDVYSFGVVLIELVSSMPAVDISRHKHEINLANLAINKIQKRALDELIDPALGYKSDEDIKRMTTLVAELAFQCLQQDKEMRPSMDEVLEELKRIQGQQEESEQDDTEESQHHIDVNNAPPPPSPLSGDEVALLKNIRLLPSPDSVAHKWLSTSTTPNTSA